MYVCDMWLAEFNKFFLCVFCDQKVEDAPRKVELIIDI